MSKIIFGAELEKTTEALNAKTSFSQNLLRPEANLFFNEAKIKSYWTKKNFFVVGVFDNAMPKLYWIGVLLVVLYYFVWIGTGVQVWLLYWVSLFFCATYFFWSPYFYGIVFRLGLRKAKYKGKVKMLYAEKLALRLLEVSKRG